VEVSQVYMDGGQLQQMDEIPVGQFADEVHPLPVLIADLVTNLVDISLLPTPAVLVVGAVADAVTTDDKHPGFRPPPEQFRQRPHEDMVAPGGLQVAIDEGNQLIFSSEPEAAAGADKHPAIWMQVARVNAIVNHCDLVPEGLRKGA